MLLFTQTHRYTLPIKPVTLPGIALHADMPVSQAFITKGCKTFADAVRLVHHLPYSRPKSSGIFTLLDEQCGTCSTKHILLYRLITELELPGWKLMLGIYRMNSSNTPGIGTTLQTYGLEYVPEAHVFLEYEGIPVDYTFPGTAAMGWIQDLLRSTSTDADTLQAQKVNLHQAYLQEWIKQQAGFPYTFNALWNIREACIKALAHQQR